MILNTILNKYSISLLITFGSFGTDRFNENSDIDIAFKSKKQLSPYDEISMLNDFVAYFGRDNIDLINLKKATPLLLYEIACKGNVLYEENHSFLDFKLYASFRYADTKHLRIARKKYLDMEIEDLKKIANNLTGGF